MPNAIHVTVVQEGDTPASIAQKWGRSDVASLIAANPHKTLTTSGSFAALTPGEHLVLPSFWLPEAVAPRLKLQREAVRNLGVPLNPPAPWPPPTYTVCWFRQPTRHTVG